MGLIPSSGCRWHLVSDTAIVRSAPDAPPARRGQPELRKQLAAARNLTDRLVRPKSSGALRPVTAVPPIASSPSWADTRNLPMPGLIWRALRTPGRVTGTASDASARLHQCCQSRALAANASQQLLQRWDEMSDRGPVAAMWVAVGKVSLDDCDMFTSSLGCNDPAWPRWDAITSLVFMLELVPEPVWKTSMGNCRRWTVGDLGGCGDDMSAFSGAK